LVLLCGCDQLNIASSKGYEECVKVLLEQGADPNKCGTFRLLSFRWVLFVGKVFAYLRNLE
jgi:ankyrin repeat protein